MVTCAWALETVPDPKVALREFCRVVRHGGVLCLAFCAEVPARAPAAWLMRRAIMWRGAGQFLCREHVIKTIRGTGKFEVRSVPSHGPVAALQARRMPEIGTTTGNTMDATSLLCPIGPRAA